MGNKTFQLCIGTSLLIIISLACSFISGLSQDIKDIENTAEAVATQAQGIATEIKDSGFFETAQAFATDEGEEFIATIEAMTTEVIGSDFLETIEAEVFEDFTNGEAPLDIPVIEDANIEDFFGSKDMVSYFTAMNFQTVLGFYKKEMPTNGWIEISGLSVETVDTAVLYYEKPDRKASLTISVDAAQQKTVVMILIQPK